MKLFIILPLIVWRALVAFYRRAFPPGEALYYGAYPDFYEPESPRGEKW